LRGTQRYAKEKRYRREDKIKNGFLLHFFFLPPLRTFALKDLIGGVNSD